MEDFFKQFRDRLEDRPSPTFKQGDWQSLQQRLAVFSTQPRLTGHWLWIATPLILLIGTNLGWWYTMSQSEPPTDKRIGVTDTLYRVQTVYQTDTVYLTRIISVPSWSSVNSKLSITRTLKKGASPNIGRISGLYREKNDTAPGSPLMNITSERASGRSKPSESEAEQKRVAVVPSRNPYNTSWPWTERSELSKVPLEVVPSKKKKVRQYLSQLGWRNIELGVLGGVGHFFHSNAGNTNGPMIGIQTSVAILPQLRLWGSVTYARSIKNITNLTEETGIPRITPPSDELVFEKAEVPQTALLYTVGLQYRFFTIGRLKPFIGVGYGVRQPLPYEFIYEFVNPTTGREWQFEGTGTSGALTGALTTQAGLAYQFARQWQWHLQLTHGLSTPQSNPFIGIQSGLHFRFR